MGQQKIPVKSSRKIQAKVENNLYKFWLIQEKGINAVSCTTELQRLDMENKVATY